MNLFDLAFRCTSLLARASLAGGLLAAAVWVGCRLFPRLPAGLRCALWWLVCLRLLIGLAGMAPVALPVLPAATVASAPHLPAVLAAPGPAPASRLVLSTGAEKRPVWPLAVALAWLAGVLVHLARAGRQLAAARRLVRESAPVDVPGVDSLTADLAGEIGLRRPPAVRCSSAVRTPQARLGG
ncbi:MAG TPA: M56 family metallopeptidase, partial [Thermoanaerobaculia bacterium]|nr:M56 family metallopeptidase [Thermoanaerobaculia bacterium]